MREEERKAGSETALPDRMAAGEVPWRIRPMTREDARWVAILEGECFSDGWSEASLIATLEGKASLYLVCELRGIGVGYVGSQVVLDEGEILRIAVSPACRRQGLGSAILQALWDRTPEVKRWMLEVRAGNRPAQELYRSHGFTEVGIRKKYYHQPEEDARILLREAEDTPG